ncbi:P-loop containing nucleoside triphosphate hydrolase protein [Mucor mucedo]|uniref:P-loop containing nucleoside triphosphate hydrolase protein n=1 Tax=Mucor mucedo TaxID=29922 RepID=UPI0022201635|nr:P-loop containing nucleoside triphosphate hydrolase protein [Mucor mucedo]KAI7865224.1 P-loop containing nucleoside triphosphate hydrolase protein [Mucor mucedo]
MSDYKTENKIDLNDSLSMTDESTITKDDSVKKKNADTKVPKTPTIPLYKLFRFASKTDKILIFLASIFSAAAGILQPCSILIYGAYISKVSAATTGAILTLEDVMPVIKLMVAMGVVAMTTGYLSNCLWVITGENQTRRIRSLYLHSALKQDMSWYDAAEDGSLNTRLASDTQVIQDGISDKFGQFISLFCQFFGGFIVAFIKGWQMALVMLALIPPSAVVMVFTTRYIKIYSAQTQDIYAEAGTIAEQVFQSIRTVQSFTLQKKFSSIYGQKAEEASKVGVKRAIVNGTGVGLFFMVLFGSFGLALWYGSLLAVQGKATGADIFIVFMAMMSGSIAIMRISPVIAAVFSAAGSAYKIFEIIDRVPEIDTDSKKGLVPSSITGSIEFKNVTFKYPSRPDVLIIDDLSINIEAGKTIAFVGPSGSGKSTTIQLVQRFYDVLSGEVTLDGHNIKDLDVKWLREQIGIVSQEPVLFNMSIRQNILMGTHTEATDAEVIAACKEANCHTFITQLPDGYDTLVGEQGGMLSGGQKQRIAIARAILKNPSILLLDEATSALDTQSERLVQNALDKASATRTTIVIAHRLSTIMKSDLIAVLDHGVIIEKGTHEELINLKGAYSNLVEKQMIGLKKEEADSLGSTNVDEELLLQEKLELEKKLASQKLNVLERMESINMERKDQKQEIDAYDLKIQKQLELKKKMKQEKAPIRRILKDLKPEGVYVILGVIGAAISGSIWPIDSFLFAYIIAILSGPTEDIQPSSLGGTNLYAFLFVILGLSSMTGNFLKITFFQIAGEKSTCRLRVRVFDAYLRQEIGFFDEEENNSGALTAKLAVEARNVNDLITKVCGDIAGFFSTIISGFTISFMHSWQLSLVVLTMLPFTVAAIVYEVRTENGYVDGTKKANRLSDQVAGEAIREARTVASLNKQSHFEERYYHARKRPHQQALRKAYLASISAGLSKSINIFTSAVAYYAGIRFMLNGWINFRQMLVCMSVIMTVSESIGVFSISASTFSKAKYAAIASYEIIDRTSDVDPDLEGIEPAIGSVRGDAEYKDIKFAYPSRPDVSIFNGDFDLKCFAGKTVALVGPSGCGKSTTVGMLQRWYNPLEGTVSLDETSVKSYSLHNLRSHMAIVSQEPSLFNMTIGENIRFGVASHGDVTQEEVEAACKSSNIHEFVVSLPEGYNTRVGNKGSQLSGGQKQRIAIARALIRKPKVLLLDEATSALDSDSERLVQEALDNIIQEGGRTTITIAHRLSTIQNADVICVLKDGLVIEQGTHWELLALNGTYSALVYEQSLSIL